jgi:hypothetical protein
MRRCGSKWRGAVDVPDFRTVKRYQVDGAEGKLLEVPELTEYPDASLDDTLTASYAVKKYGRRIDLSWETLINDDLGAFRDLPERLAKAARRSEDRFLRAWSPMRTARTPAFLPQATTISLTPPTAVRRSRR